MGNQWFRFKQFEIQQDQCAMKVGTDGVILGAWTNLENTTRALDIGTGTGLLALMLAQREPSLVLDAIEIETECAAQAGLNFKNSRFSAKITAHEISFREFCKDPASKHYDLIICNPPYFSESFRAPDPGRSLARHDDTLSLEDLLEGSVPLLGLKGRISLVIPSGNVEKCLDLAAAHALFPQRLLHIKPTPEKAEIRTCIEFGYASTTAIHESLVIEEAGRHNYSEGYKTLTKDFYLNF